jgi:hypothetical protein
MKDLIEMGDQINTLKNFSIHKLKQIIEKLQKERTSDYKDAIKIIKAIIAHKKGIINLDS